MCRTLIVAAGLALAPASLCAQPFSASFGGGYFAMTGASRSAAAIFGSSGGATVGGDLAFGLSDRIYLGAGARYLGRDGQRVFVADKTAQVFPLGYPLSVRIVPIYASGGYRFNGHRVFTPYVGLGLGVTLYHEESTVAGETNRIDRTRPFGQIVAGIELGSRALRFSTEALYSTVPGTLGLGGVSKVYGETDAGGFGILARVVFRAAAARR